MAAAKVAAAITATGTGTETETETETETVPAMAEEINARKLREPPPNNKTKLIKNELSRL